MLLNVFTVGEEVGDIGGPVRAADWLDIGRNMRRGIIRTTMFIWCVAEVFVNIKFFTTGLVGRGRGLVQLAVSLK